MNGTDILDRTRAAYARLRSYQDKGEAVSVFEYASGQTHTKPHRMPFSTWFVRPDKFRFDFAQRIGHPNFQKTCSVWERDGTPHAHGWWTKGPPIAGRERMDSLGNMLFHAGIHSNGVATRVPRLLMPERLKDEPALSAKVASEEDVAGVQCHVLEVQWSNANGTFGESWWIGVDDSLIRKAVNVMKFSAQGLNPLREKIKTDTVKRHAEGKMSDKELMAALESFKPENSPSRGEITTTYAATIDAPIPDDAFDFRPDA